MINRTLLRKNITDAIVLLFFCLLTVYLFFWLRVWITSRFEMPRFRSILEQFREFERYSPVPFEQLFTHAGRLALSFDEPLLVVCMAVWAIGRGSDCVSGEIGRGTMEMLLSQPVSRMQLLWSQATVTIVGVVLLSGASWLGLYTGILVHSVKQPGPPPTWKIPWVGLELPNPLSSGPPEAVPLREEVDPAVFVPATVNLCSLGFFLAGFTTLLSSADRHRWRTIGLAAGFYIAEVLIRVLCLAADRLNWLAWFTIFSAYAPQRAVSVAVHRPAEMWSIVLRDPAGQITSLGPLGCDLILVGLGTVCFVGASWVFQRRDLPAPL